MTGESSRTPPRYAGEALRRALYCLREVMVRIHPPAHFDSFRSLSVNKRAGRSALSLSKGYNSNASRTHEAFVFAVFRAKKKVMMDKKDVEHIAALARIELNDGMKERLKNDLGSILDYIEVLSNVPTEHVEPLYQVTGLTSRLRNDEHRNDFPMDETLDAHLTGQAPNRADRLVKVKSILKK